MAVSGTTPTGFEGETQAAAWVQRMFAAIAPRYDLLNHLLSFNIDRAWRKALLAALEPVCKRPEACVLDLCCGTGDVLLDLQKRSSARVFGADFCHPMLVAAKHKGARRDVQVLLFEGDALKLPVADNSFHAISIAFGFRNLANYAAGLRELYRVLKPGGVVAILEFSHPQSKALRVSYGLYSRFVLPLLGGLISGSRDAYSYLPESIAKFPHAAELAQMMPVAGFRTAGFKLLSGGIAALHTAWK